MFRYFSLGLIGSSLLALAACTGGPTPTDPQGSEFSPILQEQAVLIESRARTPSTSGAVSRILPIEFIRSNECAGEDVELAGFIHLLFLEQADGSVISHFNYQQITGTGLTSGTRYHASTVDHLRLTAPFPTSIHSVRSFRLIAEGSTENLIVRGLFHVTVTANGDVSVSIDELTLDCR